MCADRIAADLDAAATVHAARLQIVEAIAPLAASPLDERAADRMRRALERARPPKVRAALSRLGQGHPRPPLRLIPTTAGRTGPADGCSPPHPPVRLVRSCQLPGEGAA